MKLAEKQGELVSRGIQSTNNYKVAQTSKIMDMLSNMLYKDKIKAVIRELCTNAWDAHVMADNTEQVPVITLPNRANPNFILRDFGPGLSKDQLEDMYLTYGESNKTSSNAYNGCMGIGSKSPFAYTRSFTTISYHKGMKYVYVNSKDASNMPSLKLIAEMPTDEPDGLEISFAVDTYDVEDFKDKYRNLMVWFPKPFEVKGQNFNLPKYEYTLERPGWKMRANAGYREGSYAIMGHVCYPIDSAHFSVNVDEDDTKDVSWYQHHTRNIGGKKVNDTYGRLLNASVELHFDIGEVEMDISREGLQYTDSTIAAIKAKLDSVLSTISNDVEQEISGASTLWEARCKYYELAHGRMRNLRPFIDLDKITWKGKKVGSDNIRLPQLKMPADPNAAPGTPAPTGREWRITQFNRPSYRKTAERINEPGVVKVGTTVQFYLSDMKRGNYTIVKQILEAPNSPVSTIYLLTFNTEAEKKELLDLLGANATILKKCSDVPRDPTTTQRAKVKRENVFKYVRDPNVSSWRRRTYNKDCWESDSVDFKAGGKYVEINNWQPKRGESYRSTSEIETILLGLKKLGIKVPTVIGIKSVAVKKYQKSDNWDNFFTWAEKEITKALPKCQLLDETKTIENYDSFDETDLCFLMKKNAAPKFDKNDSKLKNFLDTVDSMRIIKEKSEGNVDEIRVACRVLGIDVDKAGATVTSTPSASLNKEWENLIKDYPILVLIDRWDLQRRGDEELKAFVAMINLIDSSKGQ